MTLRAFLLTAAFALGLSTITGPRASTAMRTRSEEVSAAITRDPEAHRMWDTLVSIAARCDVDSSVGAVRCEPGDVAGGIESFVRAAQTQPRSALPVLRAGLKSRGAAVKTAAAHLAEAAFAWGIGTEYPPLVRVQPEDTRELLAHLEPLAYPQVVRALPLLVHHGMLSQTSEPVLRFLARDPRYRIGYRHLMTYGRLTAFPHLREFAHQGSEDHLVIALDALALMPSWDRQEQAELCPWAYGYFADPRKRVRGAAGGALAQCDTETLRRLIGVANQLGHRAELAPGQLLAFGVVCSTEIRVASDPILCTSVRKLLEVAVNYPRLDAETRANALAALLKSETWRKERSVRDLAQRLTRDTEPMLTREARRALAAGEQNP